MARAVIAALLVAAVCAGVGRPSNRVTTGATAISLKVARSDTAVVSYRAHGRRWAVVACCARNARFPSLGQPQRSLRLSYGAVGLPGSCGRYDGPALPWIVAACKAPDGSYWVAQNWPRLLPNLGTPPSPVQAENELRLSHFRGPLPVFTVKQDWAFGGRFDHLYGSLSYLGHPMYGFGTSGSGNPLDRYGVLVHVDTLDSSYGSGWRRENAFVTHNPSGIFCYGFFPHGSRPVGTGRAYRATVIGPGVLPDLRWQGVRRAYDRAADAAANEEQRRSFSDGLCRPS